MKTSIKPQADDTPESRPSRGKNSASIRKGKQIVEAASEVHILHFAGQCKLNARDYPKGAVLVIRPIEGPSKVIVLENDDLATLKKYLEPGKKVVTKTSK